MPWGIRAAIRLIVIAALLALWAPFVDSQSGTLPPTCQPGNTRVVTDTTGGHATGFYYCGPTPNTWATAGGAPGGSTTQVQFNNAGSLDGSAALTFGSQSLTLGDGLSSPVLAIVGATDVGAGDESRLYFGHGSPATSDWVLADNDDGSANYEFSLTERTNNTYKIEIFKGTNGELKLNQSGGLVSIGAGGLQSSGNITFLGLETTGAASGKKVVCVDTTTGRLYASSTGVDCSN